MRSAKRKRAKNPYRIPYVPAGEPGGFYSGPEAFVLLFALIAIISLLDLRLQ